MKIQSNALADALFSALIPQQSSLDQLANTALNAGIEHYTNGKYERAITEFKRSVALSPYGDYAADAANYTAMAYLKLDDKTNAIKAYQQSIKLDPYRDDTRLSLGNTYYDMGRYQDAVAQYEAAVKVNPDASANHYSLGQGYIALGEYDKAARQFQKVVALEPNSASGNYGLGQTYAKEGEYEKAIAEFEKALARDGSFNNAYVDMGYAYADMGDIESANAVLDKLKKRDESLASLLESYIAKKEPPRIESAKYSGSFMFYSSVNTPVANLDAYLANAGAEKVMTMKFQFSKEMDIASVQNRYNWSIGRAKDGASWEKYNFGMPVSSKEALILPFPEYVSYDPKTMTATVAFKVRQNATADATIDPSHIQFQFKGKDIDGNVMDADADQYTGFSGSH